MTFTITLDEALAEQLRKKAAARQLSIEEFAVRLLSEAVEQLAETERWKQHNQRRLTLIHKSAAAPLSSKEAAELEALQVALDQRLEPMDDRLLAVLEGMQHAVDALPDDSEP